jgi:hypothetical protein
MLNIINVNKLAGIFTRYAWKRFKEPVTPD